MTYLNYYPIPSKTTTIQKKHHPQLIKPSHINYLINKILTNIPTNNLINIISQLKILFPKNTKLNQIN